METEVKQMIKIVMVGDQNVGQSTLLAYLKYGKYIKDQQMGDYEDLTEEIEVDITFEGKPFHMYFVSLKHPDKLAIDLRRHPRLLCLGTHLYVVCFSYTDMDSLRETKDWISRINSLENQVVEKELTPVLLLGLRTDENKLKVSNEDVQSTMESPELKISATCKASCKSGEGMEELVQTIHKLSITHYRKEMAQEREFPKKDKIKTKQANVNKKCCTVS